MLKYTNAQVTFSEVPDEITLCIELSNCPYKCPGCHSKYLWLDMGNELTSNVLRDLIDKHKGITCICFMGGDNDLESLKKRIFECKLRSDYPYRIAWYTGSDKFPDKELMDLLDYIKLGPYNEECGPINNPNTNQRFYAKGRVLHKMDMREDSFYDVTDKFWKNDSNM
jgi:anaerobic ribonucleoside-triphosphate reductase activating protein